MSAAIARARVCRPPNGSTVSSPSPASLPPLDNAHLYADVRRMADEQAALRRVATLVARGVGPDLVFARVAGEVGTLLGADGTAIVGFEPDGEATLMGRYGFEQAQPGSPSRPDPDSAGASVQATGRAARRDVDDPDQAGQTGTARSAVASPILVEDRVWGAMTVTSRRQRLHRDTEQRLAGFTELVATAIAIAESRAGAHHLMGADRRQRRPDPLADRAGPARRCPTASRRAGVAAAHGAGGAAARARRAPHAARRHRGRGRRHAR